MIQHEMQILALKLQSNIRKAIEKKKKKLIRKVKIHLPTLFRVLPIIFKGDLKSIA